MFEYSDLSSEQLLLWLEILNRTMESRRDLWKSLPRSVRIEAAPGPCSIDLRLSQEGGLSLHRGYVAVLSQPCAFFTSSQKFPECVFLTLWQASPLLSELSYWVTISCARRLQATCGSNPAELHICMCVSAFWMEVFTASQNSWLCFCCCTCFPHEEALSFS